VKDLTALKQGDERAVAHDNVVESSDAEELRSFEESAREGDVVYRWFRISAGMVVGEHERGGAGSESGCEYLPWVHRARIHRPFGYAHISQKQVSRVETEHVELFPSEPLKRWREVAIDLSRSPQLRTAFVATLEPSADLCGSEERRSTLRAYARRCADVKCVILQEGLEPTGACQQFLGCTDSVAISEEQGEQFGVG